jgi:PAS domain S-box-containing protein
MNEKILIVEDEAVVAAELESILTRLGYSVAGIADTGADAINLAASKNAELILMDIRIFGPMDGVQTADVIRRKLRKPVVFLTSHADPQTLARAGATEPFGYIVKPFEERDLHATVEVALHRARAEERTRRMERWLATTLNSIGDGVVTADLQGTVTYMNPMAEVLTGWTAHQACGLPLDSVLRLVQGPQRTPIPNPIMRAIQDGLSFSLDDGTFLLTRDGGERAIEDSASPVRDDEGNITGGVLVFRDGGRRQEMDVNRKRLEERMRQAQKLESLGLIAGGIAHDFNNILTSIIGHTELIREDLPENRQDSARQVLQSALRASTLCKQMMAYAGKGPNEAGPVDVSRVIGETAALARVSLKEKTRLSVLKACDVPPAHADALQLQQVILNLLLNASEAIADEGQIRVQTYPLGKQSRYLEEAFISPDPTIDKYVCIEVADSGAGIPREILPKIFDPFFSTKFAGRGLGLAAALGIVRRHRGTIHVESEVGRGTTFRVFLPESSAPLPRTKAGMSLEGSQWRGTGTILLVDDEPSVRLVTREALSRLGFTVIALSDGRAGVSVFQQRQSEIVACVIDMTMPGFSGLQTVREIRKISQTPALLISGYTAEPVDIAIESLGACAFLPKPFSCANLQEALRALMQAGD